MAAVSCGTSHASAVSTPLQWIFQKKSAIKLVTHVEPHASVTSLLKRVANSAISAIINHQSNPPGPVAKGAGLWPPMQPPDPHRVAGLWSPIHPLDPHRGTGLWPPIQPLGPPQGCWPMDPNTPPEVLACGHQYSLLDPHRGTGLWPPIQPTGPPQGCWPNTASWTPTGVLVHGSKCCPLNLQCVLRLFRF